MSQSIDNNPAKTFIDAQKLSKSYGDKKVLNDIDFTLYQGEIVGLVGPNGAGKSTLLKAIMGLVNYSGNLTVFGQNPYKDRTTLLQNMSYIADVASLPGWMKVSDLLSFARQTHPKFDYDRVVSLLSDTPIQQSQRIETLSKGMKTRLHLSLILSIDTDLLVLDEPTLGLDVLVRRDFQDRLISDYYHQQRSILITTHQLDEVESILTRVVFIKDGHITMDIKKSELSERYRKLITKSNIVFSDPSCQPMYQRILPDCVEMIFVDVEDQKLSEYGEVVAPSLEDLFVATNSNSEISTGG